MECILRRLLATAGRAALWPLTEALVGGDDEILRRTDRAAVLRRVEACLAGFPLPVFLIFKVTMVLLEFGVMPFAWRRRRFSRLELDARVARVTRMSTGGSILQRQLLTLVRTPLITSLLSEPELLDWIGYTEALERRTQRPAGADGAANMPCPKRIEGAS